MPLISRAGETARAVKQKASQAARRVRRQGKEEDERLKRARARRRARERTKELERDKDPERTGQAKKRLKKRLKEQRQSDGAGGDSGAKTVRERAREKLRQAKLKRQASRGSRAAKAKLAAQKLRTAAKSIQQAAAESGASGDQTNSTRGARRAAEREPDPAPSGQSDPGPAGSGMAGDVPRGPRAAAQAEPAPAPPDRAPPGQMADQDATAAERGARRAAEREPAPAPPDDRPAGREDLYQIDVIGEEKRVVSERTRGSTTATETLEIREEPEQPQRRDLGDQAPIVGNEGAESFFQGLERGFSNKIAKPAADVAGDAGELAVEGALRANVGSYVAGVATPDSLTGRVSASTRQAAGDQADPAFGNFTRGAVETVNVGAIAGDAQETAETLSYLAGGATAGDLANRLGATGDQTSVLADRAVAGTRQNPAQALGGIVGGAVTGRAGRMGLSKASVPDRPNSPDVDLAPGQFRRFASDERGQMQPPRFRRRQSDTGDGSDSVDRAVRTDERSDVTRQQYEQQIYEQRQRFGEIEREKVPIDTADDTPEFIAESSSASDDIGSGIAGRGGGDWRADTVPDQPTRAKFALRDTPEMDLRSATSLEPEVYTGPDTPVGAATGATVGGVTAGEQRRREQAEAPSFGGETDPVPGGTATAVDPAIGRLVPDAAALQEQAQQPAVETVEQDQTGDLPFAEQTVSTVEETDPATGYDPVGDLAPGTDMAVGSDGVGVATPRPTETGQGQMATGTPTTGLGVPATQIPGGSGAPDPVVPGQPDTRGDPDNRRWPDPDLDPNPDQFQDDPYQGGTGVGDPLGAFVNPIATAEDVVSGGYDPGGLSSDGYDPVGGLGDLDGDGRVL